MGMDEPTRRAVRARLRRIEGQVGALARMVEGDHECVDLLLQIAAAQGALGRAGEVVLASHIETCVSDAFAHGDTDERERKVDELMEVFARYGKIGGR